MMGAKLDWASSVKQQRRDRHLPESLCRREVILGEKMLISVLVSGFGWGAYLIARCARICWKFEARCYELQLLERLADVLNS